MINSVVGGFFLFIVLLSVAIIMHAILMGDNKRSTYLALILNLCMLWMALI